MEVYEKSKAFWNSHFKDKPEEIKDKFINNEDFNQAVLNLYDNESVILDFGSGSGWGLFELYFTNNFKKGIGIDQSQNGVNYANECAKLSNLDGIIRFECDNLLAFRTDYFDAAFSCNTLDVIPLDVVTDVLKELARVVKENGKIMISLNPYLDNELNKKLQMECIGNNMYIKDGVLRLLNYTTPEWVDIFSHYFTVDKTLDYELEFEQGYVRRMFILTNNKKRG